MIIYEKPGYFQVTYNAEKNFIVLDWTDFGVTLEDVKDAHQKTLEVAREKKCLYYIAETSKVVNFFPSEIIDWWINVWTPKLIEARLQAIVTVVPAAVSTLSTKEWQRANMQRIAMRNVRTFAEAEIAVKELQRISRFESQKS